MAMQIDSEFVRRTAGLRTPAMVISSGHVEAAYAELQASFPGWPVHYAVKANPHPAIVEPLHRLGAGFEVASPAETQSLLDLGVAPSRIICLHPIKSPQYLEFLAHHRIKVVAADCIDEIEKIGHHAPGSKVVLRLRVDKKGSSAGHHGKFGMEPQEAPSMFRAIRKHGLIPWGLTFHPGSQCAELATWTQALQSAAEFWATAQRAGAGLQAFIVGGGLPVSYRKRAASLAAVARSIKRTFAALPSPPEHCLLEPGRLLSAQAATLITSVVGVARRRERTWLFVDAGVFNGIPEALEFADRRFFEIATNPAARPARAKRVFIAGPSCHGLDTPFEDVSLPETALGDRLYVLDVGAYNSTNWCRFNGFELPDVQVYEALPTGAKRASSATPSARRRPSKGR